MASILDMNREEREEYVIRLYKEGRTIKDIAGLAHMSFRDIGAITNKVKLQADRERGYTAEDTQPKSDLELHTHIEIRSCEKLWY